MKPILLVLLILAVPTLKFPTPHPPKKHSNKYKCPKGVIDWSLTVAGYFLKGRKQTHAIKKWRKWIIKKENIRLRMMVGLAGMWLTAKYPQSKSAKFQLFINARVYCGLHALPEGGDPPTYQ